LNKSQDISKTNKQGFVSARKGHGNAAIKVYETRAVASPKLGGRIPPEKQFAPPPCTKSGH